MAVKAIKNELNGQKGYPEYIDWWQKAFYFHNPKYAREIGLQSQRVCSDDDLDYLYRLFQGRVGMLTGMVYKNLDLVKRDRPELYEELNSGFERLEMERDKLFRGEK